MTPPESARRTGAKIGFHWIHAVLHARTVELSTGKIKRTVGLEPLPSAKENNNNSAVPKKRRRDSLGAADGRSTTWPRTDHSDDDSSNARGDSGEEHSDDDMCGDGNGGKFSNAKSFYDTLRAEFKAGKAIDFHGTYPVPADPIVSLRQWVQMAAKELWSISSYCFTQDAARKKKSKASQSPDISQARGKQISYEDVSMPPEALNIIRDNVESLMPVAMATKVQAVFPSVTAMQIHRAWREMSEPFWCFDDDQLLSAKKLLEEQTNNVHIFELQDVPEGVEMICGGIKKIGELLKGKVVEIGVDATYNTNSKYLELYSIMEHSQQVRREHNGDAPGREGK
ncbi:hypothetical protein B0H14DRAFT_2612039 [Mycena olivaceomarginata]|nr:hypothetical protein B0H14DRAFT_2612039 [Mycena olivaceomarginata]